MLCYTDDKSDKIYEGRNIYSMINYLKQEYEFCLENQYVLCYFHNLSYDSNFILDKNRLEISNLLKAGNKVLTFCITIFTSSGKRIKVKF
jgi:hypothetical protein